MNFHRFFTPSTINRQEYLTAFLRTNYTFANYVVCSQQKKDFLQNKTRIFHKHYFNKQTNSEFALKKCDENAVKIKMLSSLIERDKNNFGLYFGLNYMQVCLLRVNVNN